VAHAQELSMMDAPLISFADALTSRSGEFMELLDLLCDLDGYSHFHVQGTESSSEYAELKRKAHHLALANKAAARRSSAAQSEDAEHHALSLRDLCESIHAAYAAGSAMLDQPLASLAQQMTSRTGELVALLDVLCGLDDESHFALTHVEVDDTFALLKNKAHLLALTHKVNSRQKSPIGASTAPANRTLQHTLPTTEALMQMIVDYGGWIFNAGLNADAPGTARDHRERAEVFLATIRESLDELQRRACQTN
jgi:prophage DNA circulation protein